ncbi:hypothetical protein, partial [Pyrobaculum sp.]|uniref:hypothetical protein n=1 Tax=Pyrobaculum sp. TaxID=2004705 RepID=UPI003D14481E
MLKRAVEWRGEKCATTTSQALSTVDEKTLKAWYRSVLKADPGEHRGVGRGSDEWPLWISGATRRQQGVNRSS